MVAISTLFSILATASAVAAQNKTLRYMPFGDSITEIVCWRAKLWNKLQADWSNVDFVGSGKTENNCRDTKYDRDNEGHSGFLAINIANAKQLVGWLQKNPADVITMHLGTNDIAQQSKATSDIIAAFTTLVKQMRDSNPRMKIVVGTLARSPCSPHLKTESHMLLPGGPNHPHGNRQYQRQGPRSQQSHRSMGSRAIDRRISHLGCRPVYQL